MATGISRSTIIVIIVVVVMAVILITLIFAFLCARYLGGEIEEELIEYVDDDDDDVRYEDSTMRSVYSTLSRGKAIAYNDTTFQGQPVILETISGKTSRYR